MPVPNYLTNVAIIGAGGNVGRFITEALLKTGKHTVTAITRVESQTILPDGVTSTKADYDDSKTLVEALRGHDALIITLSGYAPIQETEAKLVRAAGEAGVPWILPNEWSPDTANEDLVRDLHHLGAKVATRKLIEDVGQSSYIGVVTGYWYELSLAKPANYGFDFGQRAVTLFDEGDTKVSTSTWPQIGRAVAALLSLPVKSENETERCLESFKNKVVYVSSFTISQKDMLASAMRVTGTTQVDWTITKESAYERYATGAKEIKEGNFAGFAKWGFGRIFSPDGCGDFEHNRGTLNSVLGLPREDIDEATRVAIERQKTANGH